MPPRQLAAWTVAGLCLLLHPPGFAADPAPVDAPAQLDKITVTGEREEGYAPPVSSAGSRLELPLRDVPQSVTVFNAAVIEDMAPRVLDELADYIAGVDREAVQGNPYGISFFFRGFNTGGAAGSYNGYRENGFNTPQSTVNIERIEFLKGPASVLYGGSGSLSGLVNIVSKQPLAEPRNRFESSIGSFDLLSSSLDSTGPLNPDKTLRYRITASAEKDGNFVDDVHQQSLFVSPVLSWDLSPATRLDIETLAQDVDRPGREGYFQRHPDFFEVPVTVQQGDPGVPLGAGGTLTRKLGRVELGHRFDNGWKFRQGLYANNVHSDDSTIQPIGYDPQTRLVERRVRAVDEYQRERYSQTELSGEARTGTLLHQWLTGIEIGESSTGYLFRVAPYSPLDLFDPQYPGSVQGPLAVPFPGADSGTQTRAVYAQDLVTLARGLKLSAGLRYDRLKSTSEERVEDSTQSSQNDDQVSPRLGLIWQPGDRISYYTSWGRSFSPNTGVKEGGGTFDPELGEQIEAGLKFDARPGLATTVAVFEYQRRNVLTPDPDNEDFSITVGEQRARGIEFEAIGAIHRDWQIIASYGFLDAEVTQDNDLPAGDRLTGVPRHSAGLFNKVSLRRLGLERWSATAGVAYASGRESGLPNDPDGEGGLSADDVRLPSYVKLDAGLIYDAGVWLLRINGRNLTDEKIYDGYFSTFSAARAPRSVEASLALNF